MVETARRSGLLVPEESLLAPDKKLVKASDLPQIFGVDVELLSQERLVALGVLPEGSKLKLQEDPMIHTYKVKGEDGRDIVVTSHGQYFLETVIGKHGILASYLPPNSRTSEHEHNLPIEEVYEQIAGESLVAVGNEVILFRAGMASIKVPVNTAHQVVTGEQKPAFVLIVMRNAGLVPRSQWHKPTNRLGDKR